MRASSICLAVLFCAVPALADEWKEMKSQEGNFRVSFPDDPMYLPQDVKAKDGTEIKLHVFAMETDGGAISYLAFYNDYSEKHVRDTGADTILKNCQKGGLEAANAKLIKEREITLGKHPGREMVCSGESDGQKFTGAWRFYLVKNRLFQIGVIAVEKDLPSDFVKTFQDSFALLRDDK